MNKRIQNIILIFLGILLVFSFYLFFKNPNSSSEDIKKLEAVEVTEYQGKDLSSITDFRENSIKGPQYINKENYRLKISGTKKDDVFLSYDEVLSGKQSYEKVVKLNCVEGWDATILWEGILFKDLVKRNEIKEGANTIILYAYDGYSTSFPIDYIYENDIMMAYKMNGVELPPERGFPFQLVAEEKYGYKWIKWITEIEFSDNSDYEGYWESRGYSNTGNLGEKFLK